ncbi:cupin domain-containing protein [Caballeronia sp. LZ032]|uniref:cupin domain-containing protein n=1 Tax=Caballeronia sp. LZ032 TaxID=3038565 RepID=UPI00285BAC6C|nr:cupin domain-containing protein [Caballeronia sp. LZ032]MDR5877796.1 cupin domain-containing protein [Caballeronia sp. LZ032]
MLTMMSPTLAGESDIATEDAQYFEYTSSANPIGAKLISRVPFRSFPPSLYADGATRVVPLDLSAELGCAGPATGPGLSASFLRINAGEALTVEPNATSQVCYVISGAGTVEQGRTSFPFAMGDFFTLPGGAAAVLSAEVTATLYYVNDAPLLAYLGTTGVHPRFAPTRYPAAKAQTALRDVAEQPNADRRNRISVLMGNANFPQTRTVTHVLWAMFGIVPPNSVQKPHRHQSIALDFIAGGNPGVYTLVGNELDSDGNIVNPTRVDWETGMAFVTPPGYWHAHFNETNENAYVIPIQDAGLQTYLRTLDIRFAV